MALHCFELYINYILGKDLCKNFAQNIRSCLTKLLLLAAGPESCPKLLPKAAPQSCSQSYSPALLLKAVLQSCSPKLLSQSCYSANLFAKTAPQNYSTKQLPKATPQRVHAKETSTVCAVEGGCGKRAISQRYIIERSPLIDG